MCPQRAFHAIILCDGVPSSCPRRSAGFWIFFLGELSHLLVTEVLEILVCTRSVVNEDFFEDINLKITWGGGEKVTPSDGVLAGMA